MSFKFFSICIFITIAAVSYASGYAAGFRPKFVNYCEEQGLCNQEVFQVISDQSGHIWISTDNGVFSYDGKVFTHYNLSDGLTDNEVYKLIEDDAGRLWAMTGNKKLCFFSGERFIPYAYNDFIQEKMPEGGDLMEISYSEKTGLTLSVNHGGFLSIDLAGNSYYFGSEASSVDTAKCGLYVVQQGNQLLSFQYYASKRCLSLQDSIPIYVCSYELGKPMEVLETYFMQAPDLGKKYLSVTRGCVLSGGGIAQIWTNFVYIIKDGKMEKVRIDASIISINQIDELLWIGTRKGIYTYDMERKKLVYWNYLRNYGISSVAKDVDNGYWFSTLEQGVFYAPGLFLTHRKLKENETYVNEFIRDGYYFYISYRDGSIDRYNLLYSSLRPFKPKNERSKDNSFGLAVDNKGRIYTGGVELNCYDSDSGYNLISSYDFIKKISCVDEAIFAVSKRNLYHIRENFDMMTYPIGFQEIIGLSNIRQKLYVLCESGTYTFETTPDSLIQHFTPNIKNCRHVWQYGESIMGITRDGRIMRYVDKDIAFYSSPLLDDWVVNDVVNEGNVVWIASSKGIVKIDVELRSFEQLEQADGLESNNVLQLERVGDYLFYLTKNSLGEIELPISQYLTQSRINGVRFESDEQDYSNAPSRIVLSESDNEFIVYPVYNSFKQSHEVQYYYQLIGANKSVTKTSAATISYSGLASGNYDFYLTATTNNINFARPIHFELIIEKPFWKTAWFWIIIVLLFSITVILAALQIIRRIKRKEQLKREMIELRSRALNAQMNPHFMFNFLNSLQLKIIKKETTETLDYLGEFSGLIRKNLTYSSENNITLQQELELAESYLTLEKIRFKDNLVFSFEVSPEIDLTHRKVPPLLLHPFIENAIIHGFSGKKGVGKINIKIIPTETEGLLITITDNGTGIVAKSRSNHKSIGINLIRQRIKINNPNNSLTIHSTPGKGVRVEIYLFQ